MEARQFQQHRHSTGIVVRTRRADNGVVMGSDHDHAIRLVRSSPLRDDIANRQFSHLIWLRDQVVSE
jgi:hypothetical protein